MEIRTAPDPKALARALADWLVDIAAASSGRVAVSLSGGSTPKALYETLAASPVRDRFPWDRVHWFWGDERFVPPDDPQSNYGMVRRAMLDRAPVPPGNIHAIATDVANSGAAASAYERELKAFYGADRLDPARPLFDVTLLGLGPDGHTASLMPGTEVLDERRRWVAPVATPSYGPRVTLTYPTLESSRHVVFLVAGADKKAMAARLLAGDQSLPAARLRPVGETLLFADEAAAP